MGTRADFYVGRGDRAEWIGSVAWDGYPGGFDAVLFKAPTEADWRQGVDLMIGSREDGTRPAMGWPWPWEDSGTTDYAYAFDGGKVWATTGTTWFDPLDPDERGGDGTAVRFPKMERGAVTLGPRSGLLILGAAK